MDLFNLKRTPRTGWFRIGVDRPESVTEHSFGVGLMAWRAARERGLDPEKALLMGLLHDFHESRLGDIPSPVKGLFSPGELDRVEDGILEEQWGDQRDILKLLREFNAGETAEARLVAEMDREEMLIQADLYRRAGYQQADEFFEYEPGDDIG